MSASATAPRETHFLAVDPGDVHNGVCYLTARLDPAPTLWLHWSRDLTPDGLERLLETADVGGWVVESFHLYPNQAREQGYSTFPTVERIGVCKYLARRRGLFCAMQKAAEKPDGRRIGERLVPDRGKIRSISTTRGPRRAWDWLLPTQHERDAMTHGAYWAFRNRRSPLFEFDSKKAGGTICL